ncbi:G-patch domain-containing protein [Pleurotus pulmonarius]
MPLDGHAYLVAQGWAGKGSGLREGAISRPLAIAQKKTLSGLGKDRDEAFPFWDHLFSAASTSIKIKIADSDEESDDVIVEKETTVFKRTTTGILCNRRPMLGTPATSGSTTPSSSGESSAVSNVSLLTMAKREAAKKGLYSRFFRGPVLGPEDGLTAEDEEEVEVEVDVEGGGSGGVTPKPEIEETGERKRKRRKKDSDRGSGSGDEGGAGEGSQEGTSSHSASAVMSDAVEGQEKAERKKAKLERKQAREAKRKAKEERRKARELRKQEEERQVEETRAKVSGKGKDANGPEETGREQKTKKRKKRDAGDDSGNITEAGGEIKSLVSPSIADLGPTPSKPKKKRKRDTDE